MGETRSAIEWGAACMAQPGQELSGDHYLVESAPPFMFFGVVDGLGHGAKAANAARVAVEAMRGFGADDLASVAKRCHQALIGTRGVVMTLASFDMEADTLTWLSVGNVTGLMMCADPSVIPARQHLLLRGGVVGYRLPPLRTFTETLSRGDTLILATDGLRSSFLEDIPMGKPAQQMADHLLLNHSRQTDDALVVVARYRA